MLIGPVITDPMNSYISVLTPEPVEEPLADGVSSPEDLASEPLESPTEPTVDGDGEQAEQDGLTGVLRLLTAGHFEGVADVRLRIVFHDELEALQAEAAMAATTEAVNALTEAVEAPLDELTSSGALSTEQVAALDELQQGFQQEATDAVEQFRTVPDAAEAPEVLIAGLQSAFDDLVVPLEALLASSALGEPLPEPMADAPDVAPDVLRAIGDSFAAALAEVNKALATQLTLPPVSPPPGNGSAYGKFLAVYDELNATGESANDRVGQADEPPESIDSEA